LIGLLRIEVLQPPMPAAAARRMIRIEGAMKRLAFAIGESLCLAASLFEANMA
jgi:hypothetical protein